MTSLTRRLALKLFGAGSAASTIPAVASVEPISPETQNYFRSDWDVCNDRVWLGEDYWANPMEGWRIVDGAAECQTGGGDRNIHLIRHGICELDFRI